MKEISEVIGAVLASCFAERMRIFGERALQRPLPDDQQKKAGPRANATDPAVWGRKRSRLHAPVCKRELEKMAGTEAPAGFGRSSAAESQSRRRACVDHSPVADSHEYSLRT